MRAVRLHESHRRGDGAEQRLVGGRASAPARPRPAPRGRLDYGRSLAVLGGAQQLDQARDAGMLREQVAVAALEQRAPLGGNALRVLQVLVEKRAGVARIESVDLSHVAVFFVAGAFPPASGRLPERSRRDDADDHPAEEAERGEGHARRGKALVPVRHRGGEKADQDREHADRTGTLDDGDRSRRPSRARRGSRRRSRPGDLARLRHGAHRTGSLAAALRGTTPVRARRDAVLRGGNRRGRAGGSSSAGTGKSAGSGGCGSAWTAHQTTPIR